MTAKKLTIAAAILTGTTLAATTASFAQVYYGGTYGQGFYDYASGAGPYNYGFSPNDTVRGGPGPRVQSGSGTGIGAER